MNDATSASQCDTTRLIDYLKDRLSIDDEVVLVRHLDQCSSCRRELSAAAASKEVWTNAADFLKNDTKDLELLGVMDSGHDQDRSD